MGVPEAVPAAGVAPQSCAKTRALTLTTANATMAVRVQIIPSVNSEPTAGIAAFVQPAERTSIWNGLSG